MISQRSKITYDNDFDYERLLLHRNMLLNIAKQEKLELAYLDNVITFLKSLMRHHETIAGLFYFIIH